MISVLVVDDSAFMRKILSDILNSDPEISVVDAVRDGASTLKRVAELSPDVITLDIHLPDIGGIELIKKIMEDTPTPILVISALTKEGSSYTIEALQSGAVDFLLKPSGEISLDIEKLKQEIISKVKIVNIAQINKIKAAPLIPSHKFSPTRRKIVVIGASTGGPQTLEGLLLPLPKNIPSPILIVQHMPAGGFTASLAERLNRLCEIEVREAKEGEELEAGVALIAPGGLHMELISDNPVYEGTIHLGADPPELGVRPSVNKLFRSVASIFKENTIGIILTGMGSDGTIGSGEIKNYRGTIIAQAEESCVIFGMPKEVIKAGYADEILPIEKIPVALIQLLEV
ncbi:chemotaxis response regulator protein-glutamate methylesterase [Candidatus Woesearchaeota archaeon]|nr:chemotaxis response regulator protein-glutamate methylesterase [Candidatus Woesearchaeota archaeon]